MTRDEAKKLFREDRDSYGKPKRIMEKIDMIYQDFEKREKDLELEICRLKFMIDNNLGWEDMRNDNKLPQEL